MQHDPPHLLDRLYRLQEEGKGMTNETPASVLLIRANFFFEQAQLRLAAGDYTQAAESIDKGLALLKDVMA